MCIADVPDCSVLMVLRCTCTSVYRSNAEDSILACDKREIDGLSLHLRVVTHSHRPEGTPEMISYSSFCLKPHGPYTGLNLFRGNQSNPEAESSAGQIAADD